MRSQKQPSDANMQFEMLPDPKRRIHRLKLVLMLIPAMGEVALKAEFASRESSRGVD